MGRSDERGEHFELDKGLMRHPYFAGFDALAQDVGRNPLLFGKASVVTIDQDVGINEAGHVGTGLRVSNHGGETAHEVLLALHGCAAVLLRRRTIPGVRLR